MSWKPKVGFRLILGRTNGDRAVRVFRDSERELDNLRAARGAGLLALDSEGWDWAYVVENQI